MMIGVPLGFYFGYLLGALSIAMIPADIIRIPLMINTSTYAMAGITVLTAGFLSALIIRRHINRLDLVEVLKTLD
ncbi:MAG: hypothetical protein KDH94_02145 [Coxiellaceae bacterium]|nr:hypothetical protein [Coxiellaceae bacterium]